MKVKSYRPDLPEIVESKVYLDLWPDLGLLTDQAAIDHFATFGIIEGRQANCLSSRVDFVSLIPPDADVLEIGPFNRPLVSGSNVRFFDVLSEQELAVRAHAQGMPSDDIPKIDFVSRSGDLTVVTQPFDYVLSSHCLEHQPNLISHLRQVERILRPSGLYFVLIPDKRYCFDFFIAESTVAEVLEAHYTDRKTHNLKSVIEHRALTTHNDCKRHWAGDHGERFGSVAPRVAAAIREFEAAAGDYVDVHAWYFTPDSMAVLIDVLRKLSFIGLSLERLYPTRRFSNEFWMVLSKDRRSGIF